MRKAIAKKVNKRISFILSLSMMFSLLGGNFTARADENGIDDNLRVWYNFSEGQGAVTSDLSGNGNNGQLVGGATFVSGIGDGAVKLDGVNGYVKLPDNITKGLTDYTISTTYKIDKSAMWTRVFDFGNGTVNNVFYTPYSGSSTERLSLSADGKKTMDIDKKPANTSTETWMNLTVVKSAGTITIYENGAEVGKKENVEITLDSLGDTTRNYLGKSQYDGIISQYNDPYLNGKIADLRIYDKALDVNVIKNISSNLAKEIGEADVRDLSIGDTNEVKGNINLPLKGSNGSKITWLSSDENVISNSGVVKRPEEGKEKVKVTLTATVVSGDFIGTKQFDVYVVPIIQVDPSAPELIWYSFDDINGTSVIDDSKNQNNTGTLFGDPKVGDGIVGKAVNLDGSDDYVKIPNGALAGITDFTISSWIKVNEARNWARVFDFGSGTTKYMTLTDRSSPSGAASGLRFMITTGGGSGEQVISTGSNYNLPLGEWAMVTVTLQGKVGKIYLNGQEIGKNENMTLSPKDIEASTQNYIGKSQYSADSLLKADISEFKMYSKALSVEKIQELYSVSDEYYINDATNALNLNIAEEIVSDIDLPKSTLYNIPITWQSSNEGVISKEGKVTRPAEDTEVTLTANLVKGKYNTNKDFTVKVLAVNSERDLEKDMENLTLGLTKVATDDLYLKLKGEFGSDITWKSDDTSLVEDNGKIHRPAKGQGNKTTKLTATIKNGDKELTKSFDIEVLEEYSAYVMAYFRGGGSEVTDSLNLAYSYDGINWTPLNNNSGVLFPKIGTKHIRDPFIFRKQDGTFGLLATNNWSSNQIYVWDSENMMDYENERLVTMNTDNQHAWAPECVYDNKNGEYRIFWSGDVIYSNTTKDFNTMSGAEKYFDPGFAVIDANVFKSESNYYMLFKDERESGKNLQVAKSSSLDPGSFKVVTPNFITPYKCEGPTTIKSLDEDKWYVLYDRYYDGKWGVSTSNNLDDPNSWTTLKDSEFLIPSEARHGSTVMVTEEELQTLINKFGDVTNKGVAKVEVTTKEGVKPELPSTVEMKYSDGSTKDMPVTWDEISKNQYSKEGTFEVEGKVQKPSEYKNPLIEQRADPFIYKHTDGYYYFTASVPKYDKIILRRAKTIEGLSSAEEVTIWSKHESGIMGAHIWAPELHYIDGKWYIYFAAGAAENVWDIKPYVLECESANPLEGQWSEKGVFQKATENNSVINAFSQFSLDSTTFEHNGQRYLIWAQKDAQGLSCLFMDKMVNPWTIEGNPMLLTKPEYAWENVRYKVNEGPSVIKKNGKIFVVFSAAGTGAEYCMGLLTADENSDLMDKTSWSKTPYPILTTEDLNGEYGPGHNSFTVSETGEDILVYHARPYKDVVGDALSDPNRHTRVKVIHWNSDGTPNLKMTLSDIVSDDFVNVKAKVNVVKDVVISSIKEVEVQTKVGILPTLPNKVEATFSDGTVKEVNVVWNEIDPKLCEKSGVFEVNGDVEDTEIDAVAKVTVVDTPTDNPKPGDDNGNTPGDNGGTPGDNGNTPGDNGGTPGDNGNTSGDNGGTPADNGSTSGNNGNTSTNNGSNPVNNDNNNQGTSVTVKPSNNDKNTSNNSVKVKLPQTGGTSSIMILVCALSLILVGSIIFKRKERRQLNK